MRTVALLLAAGITTSCYKEPMLALQRMTEAKQIAADLRVALTQAADASDLAVMATSDEESTAFARDAGAKMQHVQTNAETLRPILAGLRFLDEERLLEQFEQRFNAYRELDRRILELSVENTNLKAQRLSAGPVQEAAEAFRVATEAIVPNESAENRVLVLTAIAAIREIQVLEAPHIAEAEDAAMTRLERKMAECETTARGALETLAQENATRSSSAEAALNRFVELHSQVLVLSRRNSNVRSLAMSLGQKRMLTAQCEDALRALSEALDKRGFVATR